jgi:hypothetical protein
MMRGLSVFIHIHPLRILDLCIHCKARRCFLSRLKQTYDVQIASAELLSVTVAESKNALKVALYIRFFIHFTLSRSAKVFPC